MHNLLASMFSKSPFSFELFRHQSTFHGSLGGEKNAAGFDKNRHCGKEMDASSAHEHPRHVDSTTGRYVEIYGTFIDILQDFLGRAARVQIQIHDGFERPWQPTCAEVPDKRYPWGWRADEKRLLNVIYHPRNPYILHLDRWVPDAERIKLDLYAKSDRVFRVMDNVNVMDKADAVTYMGSTAIASIFLGSVQIGIGSSPSTPWNP